MKKLLVFTLLLALLLTTTACRGEPTSSPLPDALSSTTTSSGTESGTTIDSASDSDTTTSAPTEITTGDASASVTTINTGRKPSNGIYITKPSATTNATTTKSSDNMKDYDLTMYTNYLWTGNTVYYETLGFVETAPGNVVTGTLLYTPSRMLSVKSCDLQTTYVEGKDYIVEGNTIRRTKSSTIPVCPYDTYAPKYTGASDWLVTAADPTRYIQCTTDVQKFQIAVTYEHKGEWRSFIPTSQLDKLPRTKDRLQNKKGLHIVFFGDSITAGFDASGLNDLVLNSNGIEYRAQNNRAPYTPSWAVMVSQRMNALYGSVTRINRAASGTDSGWGIRNIDKVNAQNPDLVVIGFGMNEVNTLGPSFQQSLKRMISAVRAVHPEAEFVLVSSMLPNRDANAFKNQQLEAQEEAMYQLAEEYEGVAVTPVNRMFRSLEEMGKVYTDYTGNNLNHPNDFSIRLYAQTLLATLALED